MIVVVHDATLVDCTGAEPQPHVTAVVEDGVVTNIDLRDRVKAHPGATVINAAGRTVQPG